jgi:hypothetical protein
VPDCLQPAAAGVGPPSLRFANLSAFFAATSLTGNFAAPSKTGGGSGGIFDLTPMEIAAYNVTFT